MRILVVGLDGAAPEDLLGQEDLANVRRLMEAGCFGRLEGPVPHDNFELPEARDLRRGPPDVELRNLLVNLYPTGHGHFLLAR